ncbi:sodium- and chloride-dependent neutral and basic amino acid transporter B(0+)-like [Drosophila eugracilis]|uniref:sodium- and chloride-dependent neutral and basic amino acid transporter B(0+)-like n=1 Tax=Drosophila eugracilis TaxID=29029 RepID=UPI001BD91592|nr:sodium- and chloride-dependent neutral and basic amino acid transporter B(0+)-like [Drosophila eugracilis]
MELKSASSDLGRGQWEKPTDFIFACIGLVLKTNMYGEMSIVGMLPYFVYMVIYVVPVLVIHSYMGQFSSSGFISALRLAPFFKGIGYLSIFLTTIFLIYYVTFASVPLFYIWHSFKPILPWSCEGLSSWFNESQGLTTCHLTMESGYSYINSSTHTNDSKYVNVPSSLYFDYQFTTFNSKDDDPVDWNYVGLCVLIWATIAVIFYKFSETAKFGKIIRYMVVATLCLLLVCFVRISFIPGAMKGMERYLAPKVLYVEYEIGRTFGMVVFGLGAGWGSVIALSSFNGFRTNIMSYSWIISIGQVLIFIMFDMLHCMIVHYYEELSEDHIVKVYWTYYLSGASALSSVGWPNLWTILFYTMLLMAGLIVLTTQIFTILQSLFDEFETLRKRKMEVTFGLIGGLAVCSCAHTVGHVIMFVMGFAHNIAVTHSVLHFLLILVVFWIYGRERFQRDIEFMLGQPFASWKVFTLRFMAPFILLGCLVSGIKYLRREHYQEYAVVHSLHYILLVPCALAIPAYGFYYVYQNSGSFCERFRRTCRPTDWYPVEKEHRQRYGEAVGQTEVTDQLFELIDDVNE